MTSFLPDTHAVDFDSLLGKLVLHLLLLLLLDFVELLLDETVLLELMLDGADEVGGIVEHLPQVAEGVLHIVEHVFNGLASDGFDASNASCYRRLRQDANHADAARVVDVY